MATDLSESVVVNIGESVVEDAPSVAVREGVPLFDETTSLASSVDWDLGLSLVGDELAA